MMQVILLDTLLKRINLNDGLDIHFCPEKEKIQELLKLLNLPMSSLFHFIFFQ